MPRFLIAFMATVLASIGFAPACAQSYPQRAVKLILPFGPAAGVDITARLIGDKLSARWGKPVIIENRPGGDGLVAINAFTGAADDHTLLFTPTTVFTAHPYTQTRVPYDAERDLLPIATVTVIVIAITVPESLKVGSLGDFVALARAQPNTLNVAAAAGNSEFSLSGLIKTQNLPVAKVPYRDIMQAPNDLAEARIHLLMAAYAAMRPLVLAGRIKVIAVTGLKRSSAVPDVPTVGESGFPLLGLDGLIGAFGPRGMTAAIREQIAADIKAVVEADPEIAARLTATGQVLDVRGPADFAAAIKQQHDKLASIAEALGIKAAQ